MNRLREKYLKEVVPALKKELNLTNPLAVPKISKIVLNMGIKEGAGDKGVAQKVADQLSLIAGQKALITRARQAIAAFKTRKNDPIGAAATLRGERMYQFLDKLISIVLPRVRDFQGMPLSSFDGRGNYSLGFKEQIVFREVDYDTIDQIRGLQVTIVTTAKTNEESRALLTLLGIPFVKNG